jgi:ABC-type antimicrobial peptide transport system permease subunit
MKFNSRKLYRLVRDAIQTLRRNYVRSVLTVLGIVIGIMAVIATMEIGNGAAISMQTSIQSMGSNNIMILPGAAAAAGVMQGAGSLPTLTPDDVETLKRDCDSLANAAPIVQSRMQVVYGNANWVPANMFGTTPDYLAIRDWLDLQDGACFTQQDVRNSNKVCIVGKTIVRELFDGESPIGKTIRVRNVPVTVIGVLSTKGANVVGMDQDDIVLMPWTTMKYRISGGTLGQVNQSAIAVSSDGINAPGDPYPRSKVNFYPVLTETQLSNNVRPQRLETIDQIIVQASSNDRIASAMDEITSLLRANHRLSGASLNDFSLLDMSELAKMFTNLTGMMTSLLLAIATISLLVAGVGIMNIMLVSVTERTKEIGLRMAVGAKPSDIMRQFLTESILLCIFGGTLGIIGGRSISTLIAHLLNWPIGASPVAIFVAVSVSVLIGITFGYYPAHRAAQLDPIEALRFE